MGLLNKLFGLGASKNELLEYIQNGAVVIDVRTPGEFSSGNVPKSKNIPLQQISDRVAEIKKLNKPIVLCCASGMRSKQATQILKSNDIDCINGGSWMQVAS